MNFDSRPYIDSLFPVQYVRRVLTYSDDFKNNVTVIYFFGVVSVQKQQGLVKDLGAWQLRSWSQNTTLLGFNLCRYTVFVLCYVFYV